MSIDYSAIRTEFISIISDGVGTSLSTMYRPGGDVPSVIGPSPSEVKPDYPYIIFDIVDTVDEQGLITNHGVDDNGFIYYETYKKMLINISCRGGDAVNILNDLTGYFRMVHKVQQDLRDNLGGSIVDWFEINKIHVQLSDKWIDVANFNLSFNILDTITDSTAGYGSIDTVQLDGELYRHDDDPTPLTVTVNAP